MRSYNVSCESNLATKVNYFKCCKNKAISAVVCIKCRSSYPKSSIEGRKNVTNISKNTTHSKKNLNHMVEYCVINVKVGLLDNTVKDKIN